MELDTRALTGLRVLLNLWIMIFHAFFVLMYFVTDEEITNLFGHIAIIEHGYLAVDGFFMLTGFLLILPLLQEQDKLQQSSRGTENTAVPVSSSSRPRASSSAAGVTSPTASVVSTPTVVASPNVTELVHRYWRNRFIRVMIPYLFLGILHCFVINRCGVYPQSRIRLGPAKSMFELFFPTQTDVPSGCDTVWANVLHIPFLLPFNGTFMHSWSLGVQYHVWLLFPLVWYHFRLYERNKLYKFTFFCVLFSVIFRGIAQYHSSTPGIEKGSIIGGVLDLFWYSSPFARAHIILLGSCIGKYIYDSESERMKRGSGSAITNTENSTVNTDKDRNISRSSGLWIDGGILILIALFLSINLSWSEWTGEDSRYSRLWYHRFFAMFLQVGTPLSGIVWMSIMYALLIRPGPISESLSHFLSIGKVWNRLADLSYLAFLLHPMLMTLLFSSPYFLYPPSKRDNLPASDIPWMVENVNKTLHSVPVIPSFVANTGTHIFETMVTYRETFLPSGSPLSYSSMINILCVASILVTYLVSWIGEQIWEKPLITYVITRTKQSINFNKYFTRIVIIYSWIVIGTGILIIPLVTILGYFYITPDIERWIKEQFTNNSSSIINNNGTLGNFTEGL